MKQFATRYAVILLFLTLGISFNPLNAQSLVAKANESTIQSDITFSRAGGTYSNNFALSLSSAAGLTIRYTFDNSDPSLQNGITYGGPISISNTRMIRVRSYDANGNASEAVSQTYIKVASDLQDFSSDMPIMIINSFNSEITDGDRVPSYLEINDVDASGRTTLLNDDSALKSTIVINKRGASSLSFPKNGYGFHLKLDDFSDDRKEQLLGMPEEHNWILHGPYTDMTLMRNVYAFDLARQLGWYAPRTRYVELFMHSGNGSLSQANYHGVYVLMERIKRDDNRVNITKLRPEDIAEPDISGGYIFKVDRLGSGESGFRTRRSTPLVFVSPDEEDLMPAQKAWIADYMSDFEEALYRSNFTDPDDGYAQYINVDSFIDHFLLTELLKEIDGYRLSTYMYKDRDGKVIMGPLWDFNLSLGIADYLEGWEAEGWYYDQPRPDYHCAMTCAIRDWYVRLLEDPAFKDKLERRWWTLREGQFSTAQITGLVDSNVDILSEAQERNFDRWPVLGTYVWPNYYYQLNTWSAHVNTMRTWLTDRLSWIDSQMGEKRFQEEPTADKELAYYWLFDSDLENDTPFEQLPSTYTSLTNQAILTFESSLSGYPFNAEHPDWRTASMERRNRPTVLNYRANANEDLSFENSTMRALQIRQPFQNESRENTLIFSMPTNGSKDVVFSFAAMDEDAADRLVIEYQTEQNSSNWSQDGLSNPVLDLSSSYQLFSVDFDDVESADNNPNFKVRIRFEGTDMTASEGERVTFNNFSLDVSSMTDTSLDEDNSELATQWVLKQNYPNPFNPQTNIQYSLAAGTEVRLEVFNMQGQRVALLREGWQSAGSYTQIFDGQSLSSGLYLYRLTTNQFSSTKSMILIK